MISTLLVVALLMAPVLVIAFAILRIVLVFTTISRQADLGVGAVSAAIDRASLSLGSKPVSLILDLEDVPADQDLVALVQRFLGQRYRALEVLVLTGDDGVPAELAVAFDTVESSVHNGVTMHRSQRDDRLALVTIVNERAMLADDRVSAAVQVAAGELVLPVDYRWELKPLAIAELAAPWLHHPTNVASFGVIHPVKHPKKLRKGRTVSMRADLIAMSGLGNTADAHAVLGAIGSGNDGGIIGMFQRRTFVRMAGLDGPLRDPATWTFVGDQLRIDADHRTVENRIEILPQPMGTIYSSVWSSVPAFSEQHGPSLSRKVLPVKTGLIVSQVMPILSLVSFGAAIIGLATGWLSADLVLISLSAPIVATAVLVMTMIMDDRALRPVGSTRERLRMLIGSFDAGLSGMLGSPFRWPAGIFNRA